MSENLYSFKHWHSSGLIRLLSSICGGSDSKLSEIQGKVKSMSFGKASSHWEGVLSARVRHSYPSKISSTKANYPLSFSMEK